MNGDQEMAMEPHYVVAAFKNLSPEAQKEWENTVRAHFEHKGRLDQGEVRIVWYLLDQARENASTKKE